MAIALHSVGARFGLLALLIFIVGTLLHLSFPNSLQLADFQSFHSHSPDEWSQRQSPPPKNLEDGPPPPDANSNRLVQGYANGNGELEDIHNATLGFQKIYVLSMPGRSDKRDMMALTAHLSGIQFEFVDGVNGANVPVVARPDGWEDVFSFDAGNPDANLGCWRGHMDIYQKMLRENVQSALVIEDDVDWDVLIKTQMTEVARGSKHLFHKNDKPSHSPYGDDWWLISTGNCATRDNLKGDQERWVINDDPTVVPRVHRHLLFEPQTKPEALSGPNTRLIFDMRTMICTGSYAITLEGARNLIYDQAVLPHARTIDFGISDLCQGPGAGKCLGVYPPITGIYNAAGDKSKESDRTNRKGRNDVASSTHLVYSARLNYEGLLRGEKIIKSQYPEESMMKTLDQTTFKYPSGKLVTIPGKEFEEANRQEEERVKKDAEWKAGRKESFRKAAEEKEKEAEEEKKKEGAQ